MAVPTRAKTHPRARLLGDRSSEKKTQNWAKHNSNFVRRLLRFGHVNGEKEMHPNIKSL